MVGTSAAAAGVETGLVPGRPWLDERLGLDGPDGVVPKVAPGRIVSGSFASEHRLGKRCGWTIAYPPGAGADLPVAVVLHGRGNDNESAFDPQYLALGHFLADAVRRGGPPFALATRGRRRELLASRSASTAARATRSRPRRATTSTASRPPAGGFERGGHDVGYWRRIAPRQLRFLGAAFG